MIVSSSLITFEPACCGSASEVVATVSYDVTVPPSFDNNIKELPVVGMEGRVVLTVVDVESLLQPMKLEVAMHVKRNKESGIRRIFIACERMNMAIRVAKNEVLQA